MAKYIDVYLLPLPKKNLAAYKKMATDAGKMFKDYGALEYREYVASDMKVPEGLTPFPNVIKLKKDEVLLYAHVTYRSEAHRNKSLKAMFKDPEMSKPHKPLFDMARMVYGGFAVIVDL